MRPGCLLSCSQPLWARHLATANTANRGGKCRRGCTQYCKRRHLGCRMQYMLRYPTIAPLIEMAEEQWGFVTRRQALRLGVSRRSWERLTTTGEMLEKVAHGVYRLRGVPPPDHQQLRAAWLQLAPDV